MGNAHEAFRVAHDRLVDLTVETTNSEDMQGIYTKAQGYVARVAMIIYCLELALISVAIDGDSEEEDTYC